MNLNTWLEIDAQAFINNIKEISKVIFKNQKIALVLKSNAYGHDIVKISSIADNLNEIKYLCTANLSEAIKLRKNNIKKPIIILSYIDDNLEKIVLYNIQATIYNIETAIKLNQIAQKFGAKILVHIKVDTGMSRLGIKYNQILEFIIKVQYLTNLEIVSIFSHLCDTSNPESNFNSYQISNFNYALELLQNNNITIANRHILSSSGLYLNNKNFNILRIGGLAYGLWKSKKHRDLILTKFPKLNLRPIACWKTKIIEIKNIKANSYIGYNISYKTAENKRIAILPVGYSDGLPYNLSNKGHVYINKQKAAILGTISMNLTIIDITKIKNIYLGQEVNITDSAIDLGAAEIAQEANTILNELITRIPSHVKRIFKENLDYIKIFKGLTYSKTP